MFLKAEALSVRPSPGHTQTSRGLCGNVGLVHGRGRSGYIVKANH